VTALSDYNFFHIPQRNINLFKVARNVLVLKSRTSSSRKYNALFVAKHTNTHI